MTNPATSPGADDEGHLDKSIRLYRELGFSSERIAGMLVRHGYSREQIGKHFPDVPKEALPQSAKRSTRSSPGQLKSTAARRREDGVTIEPIGDSLRSVMGKIASGSQVSNSQVRTESLGSKTSTSGMGEPDEISFQYVPLIQCSFPHGDPGEITAFSRRNGWLELTLSTARPDTGLPYGVPARLLTIFCASEAIRTRSPEIYLGTSIHEFLRRLDVPISRGERGSLRVYANQLLRLIHCAISIDENIRDAAGRQGLHIRQALFVNEARLWWDQQTGIGQGSSLVLSSALFESILERSAPLSTNAIRQLRKSPMDLDVYAWLVHRLFQLTRPSSMSWDQLSGQFGHNYGEIRYFRRFFGDSLKRVLNVYPDAKVKWTDTGLTLLPSKPHVERRVIVKA